MTGNRLEELRQALGWSRVDVAARLGLKSEATVKRWETGETGIPDERKLALAELYGVSVTWLMGWEDQHNGGNGERAAA